MEGPPEIMTVMITIVYFFLKSVLSALHNTHSGPGNEMFTKHTFASPSDYRRHLMKNVTISSICGLAEKTNMNKSQN